MDSSAPRLSRPPQAVLLQASHRQVLTPHADLRQVSSPRFPRAGFGQLPPPPGPKLTWAQFRQKKLHVFIHHFAGSGYYTDLGPTIVATAECRGLRAAEISVDRLRTSEDLDAAEPFNTHLRWAENGDIDGFHAGFPCSSAAASRLVNIPGLPGPVRDAQNLYGLPGNTPEQQAEADMGTRLAEKSALMCMTMARVAKERGRLTVATGENPRPKEAWSRVPSLFSLPAWQEVLTDADSEAAAFPLCAYGVPCSKWMMLAGFLRNLNSMSAEPCGQCWSHPAVDSPDKVKDSGHYPADMCVAYASLVVDAWESNLEMDFADYKARTIILEDLDKRVRRAQAQIIQSMSRITAQPRGVSNLTWSSEVPTTIAKGPSSSKIAKPVIPEAELQLPMKTPFKSKKLIKQEQDAACIGGMRNPNSAVARNGGLGAMGMAVRSLFEDFAKRRPEVLQIADNLGLTTYTGPTQALITDFRLELASLLGATHDPRPVVSLGKQSPLQPAIIDKWLLGAGDPEIHLGDWIRNGAPLGMAKPIPTCGIFPPVDGERAGDYSWDLSFEEALAHEGGNYTCVADNLDDAVIEITRLLDEKFGVKIPREEVAARYPAESHTKGCISKLAIIVKVKEDGSKKRRIIVDLKRSGANSMASIPERPVLPRLSDACTSILNILDVAPEVGMDGPSAVNTSENEVELVQADFSDAYMHFRVHEDEWPYVFSYGLDAASLILWVHLCFGLRGAPLVWSRLAAALGRMLQGLLLPLEGRLQLYLDDPLWVLRGSRKHRNWLISMLCLVLAALGIKMSWPKCKRGRALVWIGVQFRILAGSSLELTIPEKKVQEILRELASLTRMSMVSFKRLRSLTGLMSWVCGVLPRVRWTVRIMYGTLVDAMRDEASGAEATRAERRSDRRPKYGMLAAKRLGFVLHFLSAFWAQVRGPLVRTLRSHTQTPALMAIVDASPWGMGGVLVHVGTSKVLAFFESQLTEKDERDLGISIGESSAQAIAETLALLLAINLWGNHMRATSCVAAVRSDSSVALAVAEKLESPSAVLNFLGAELALRMEALEGMSTLFEHIPGKLNTLADALSRLHVPNASILVPKELEEWKKVPEAKLVRDETFYSLPTPVQAPELWMGNAAGLWASMRSTRL